MKKYQKIGLALVLLILFLVVLLCGLKMLRGSVQDEALKVTILKTGKSDAIVLQSDGCTMLMDTAEIDDTPKLTQFLQENNIHSLDYLLITHFDKDHCGGAAQILQDYQVKHVLLPDYTGTIAEYKELMAALQTFAITPQLIGETTEFTLGAAQFRVDPALITDYDTLSAVVEDYDNTLSLITTVTCGDKKLLFTGDADRRRLDEWLANSQVPHCDFLKVPHHGQFNASMDDLLEAVSPDYAAITCSKKNPANESMVSLMQQYGADVYSTRNGAITVVTDGKTMNILQN